MTSAWLRSNRLVDQRAHVRDDPFLFVWDPVSHLDEVALVAVKDKFSTPHRTGGYADLSLDVVGVSS